MDWLIANVWMIPLYPLLAFGVIVLSRTLAHESGDENLLSFTRTTSMMATILATLLGLIHTVPLIVHLLGGTLGDIATLSQNWTWIQAGTFKLSVGYQIDPMSVMMLFVVTFISLFIQIYTHGYMKHDGGYAKFYAYLALFNFSMLGLVLSTNLFQMYIFWELVGVSSYLLIGFWFHRTAAAKACVKAFLMNRVGDFGLLLGILSFLFFTYGWWMDYLAASPEHVMLSFSGIAELVKQGPGLLAAAPMTLIAFLIFMGPMAKSAQVPLHTWLPDAMEGPTPISALIHAATMVAAGIYMVGRVYPIFELSATGMMIVAVIGTVTAVIAATIAMVQTDIKKALAYSTCSQLGFMMAAMGCGAFGAGLFHLFTHAFFKAMLFLCSGSVIHACEDEQDMTKMGGLLKKLPVTGTTYLIGTLAISGMLWTSGFWSKDEILVGAQGYSTVIFWVLAITAGATAFYMFRTFFMTFLGKYRGSAHVHKEDPVMVLPLAVLAVPSLFIGLLLSGVINPDWAFSTLIQSPSAVLEAASHGVAHHGAEAAHGAGHGAGHGEHHVGFFTDIGLLSMVLGFAGFALAAAMYWKPIIDPAKLHKMFAPLHQLFTKKWYFDEMYEGLVSKVYMPFANDSSRFDRGVIDGIVNGVGQSVMSTGAGLKTLQTGQIQTYVAGIFFGVVALTLLFMFFLL